MLKINSHLSHTSTHTHRSLQSKARYSSISPSASITLGISSPWLLLGVTCWVTSTEGRHKTALRPCTHNLPHTQCHENETLQNTYNFIRTQTELTHWRLSLCSGLPWRGWECELGWRTTGILHLWDTPAAFRGSCHTQMPQTGLITRHRGCTIMVKLIFTIILLKNYLNY